jgi:ribosome modulation factor
MVIGDDVTYEEIAWALGYNAAMEGKTEADCPYPECSKLRASWLVGFECYTVREPPSV